MALKFWRIDLRETRNQILFWYSGLIGLFLLISLPLIYSILFTQVDRRVRQAVTKESETFREIIQADPPSTLDHLQEQMSQILRTALVEDDVFLIAILEGRFYRSSPQGLPTSFSSGSELMAQWMEADHPQQGEHHNQDPEVGSILYRLEPVFVGDRHLGSWVVAHTTAGERAEIEAVMVVVLSVLLAGGGVAVLLAWWVSGQILRPLRQITDTVQQLSATTLSQRIPAQGAGELATLARTCNQMLDRLQATFANQQSFINDASHELRTPIAIIQGHLDLIGELPPEQQEVVDLVLDETERMSRFVRDLLLLCQSEQPDFINPAWVELEGLTEEIYNKARGLVKGEVQLDAKARGQVSLDRQRITQALLNLVENAIQHTPETGVIALGSDLSDAHVCFWVRDTGVGITLGDQQRIFERFARSSATPRRSDGAGLGLSIVKAIATACQGRVELYSRPGKGATFMLLLPLHPPHPKTD